MSELGAKEEGILGEEISVCGVNLSVQACEKLMRATK